MESNSLPSLPRLTPDDRPWRIDWFGEVAYPGSVKQYRQPCIKVAISPLMDSPESLAFSNAFRTNIQHQCNVWMPIGSLSMLRIGDVWQDGRLLTSPLYSQTYFQLSITPETTTLIKAGLAVDGDYLLPFAEHPWHRLHTQTYCLAVKATEDTTLIIPGAELVRFYFGSSSNLLQRLVTSPLTEHSLWRGMHFDSDKRHLHLKLANGLSPLSAADIGRIAMDPHAWKAAASIYANCLKATSQGDASYLYTGFPFQGETDVVAVGMWLPFGDQPRSNFLVFNLRNCSHPFPFDSLTYEVGDRLIRKRDGGPEASSSAERLRRSRSKNAESVLEPGDPGARRSSRRFTFDHTIRFTDLKRKSIWREQIAIAESVDVMLRHADGSLGQLVFGEPEGSGAAGAVDGCQGKPRAEAVEIILGELPHFVRVGIALAMSLRTGGDEGVTVKLLLPFGRAEPVFSLPRVVDEDGVIDATTLYNEPDGSHREKRACFVGLFQDANEKIVAVVEGWRIGEQPQVFAVPSATLEMLIATLCSCMGGVNLHLPT